MRSASPLRYPGGKWRLTPFFERLIALNGLSNYEYVEPYAGGGSLAVSLLFSGSVSHVHLNDLDPAVYSFWWSALNRTEELVRLIRLTPLTIKEWKKQRIVYSNGLSAGRLALGFATFYLNRTNHSGIMNGGVIGGKKQEGMWTIEARFNKPELERRIQLISVYRNRIHISCQDALKYLQNSRFSSRTLVYLDPPYYRAGKDLYLNAYTTADHKEVRAATKQLNHRWVVSYDDVPQIRRLYRGSASRRVTLLHTARTTRIGKEVMYFSSRLKIPRVHSTHG